MGGFHSADHRERARLVPLSLTDPAPTYTVSTLCDEIHALLAVALPSLWVSGEVQRVKRSQRGHLYFELIEKGGGDEIAAKLDAVIWRNDFDRIRRELEAVGQKIDEGVSLRCRAGVDFYPPGGRLQLVIREVDPLFTLGLLEKRRRELLAELSRLGLLDRNASLDLPLLPLRLGLITSAGSAAYHDFLATLAESGYGFEVLFVHAAVQGRGAEREIASALSALGGLGVDCVVLVRGGGARSDLAVFDHREVALAICASPVPVITGLGHEIDQSIADLAAHTAVKTPTKAAELLVARLTQAEQRAADLASALRAAAALPIARGRSVLALAERSLVGARYRLNAATLRLARMGKGLSQASAQSFRGAEQKLLGYERLAATLSPERTLARGFSVARTLDGRIVRSPAGIADGEKITIQTQGGTFSSRVEAGH